MSLFSRKRPKLSRTANDDQMLWQDAGSASISTGATMTCLLIGALLFLGFMIGMYHWLRPTETALSFSNGGNTNVSSGNMSNVHDPIAREALEDRSKNVIRIYFTADGQSLKAQTIEQHEQLSNHQRMLFVIQELLAGPTTDAFYQTVPKGVMLRAAYIRGDTAILDFDDSLQNMSIGGATAELLCAQAIVLSLTQNVPFIRKVQVLIEGKSATTLWDQVDLNAPLIPDLSYIQ